MKIFFLTTVFCLAAVQFYAQRITYEFTSYAAPKGWKKEVKANTYTSYTTTNIQKKTYCRIFVMLSTASKVGLKEDFESEWQNLVVKQYNVITVPNVTEPTSKDGWQAKGGIAPFTFNKGKSTALLTTMSGYNKAVSIVAVTNSEDFMPAIQSFLESVTMKKPSADNPVINQTSQPANQSAENGRFAFTSTNFDDGWAGTEQPDWVRVSKGNTVVLIHYLQPNIRDFANLDEKTAFVWNTIIAPRYSNISNLWIRKSWYADGDFMNGKYFAEADLTENASGIKVHVVLYKNGSNGKWLEFITPDKTTFQNQFAIVYQQDGTNWDKLSELGNYNKFAVAASDLPGNWKSSSGAGIEYYNVYTGNNMGLASASSTTEFIFQPGGTYTSIYKGVDGFNGNNRYVGETYSGNSTVTNWEMKLTNRLKGATEIFAVQFEAVKGGRILHMYRGNIEELHLFKIK